jgi:hypothetical protein
MPQHKGCKKDGGRKKGSKNKRPQMAPLRIQLRDVGFNLGVEMIKFYETVKDEKIKFQLFELMSKYTNVTPIVETYVDPGETEDDETEDDTDSLLAAVQ